VTVTRIEVGGQHAYQVVIGTGVLAELPALVGRSARTVVVVHPQGLGEVARPVCGVLTGAGYAVHGEEVPAGEAAKTVSVAADLWSRLAAHRLTRSDVIVGVGGGATTDLAGFVAATWLRGVRLILVPTTLLAVVDAAVGGKTAVNIEAGKNLVGAFHPPAGVIADLAILESLPSAEYVSGLAEVIKAGFIADPAILDLVEADPGGAVVPHGRHARELVERAVRMKAGVVAADLRESGRREILNYGHTLGHAIERVERYQIRHGRDRHGLRRGAGPAGRPARRPDPGPPPQRARRGRPAHHLPARGLARAAGDDGGGQEDARRPDAFCRAGRARPPGDPRRPTGGPDGPRLRGTSGTLATLTKVWDS
jgi:3-dehydroquinate synthase